MTSGPDSSGIKRKWLDSLKRSAQLNSTLKTVEDAMAMKRRSYEEYVSLKEHFNDCINPQRFCLLLWRLEHLFAANEFTSDVNDVKLMAYATLSVFSGWRPWLNFLQIQPEEVRQIERINTLMRVEYELSVEGAGVYLDRHILVFLNETQFDDAYGTLECLQKNPNISYHIGTPPTNDQNCAICTSELSQHSKMHEQYYVCDVCYKKLTDE